MENMISENVLLRAADIRRSFQLAKPFKHVCIENFFSQDIADKLLTEFPKFDPKDALNEFGKVGRKAVKTDIRNISPIYEKLFEYISSPAFLKPMSDMLGIPDLLFDPGMYGGGTHENLAGQELDPHVDFNYDQGRKLHRRVNLLLYLNKEWDISWGGAIELHSNPRDWEHDEVTIFNCTFNRCVIFETNEYSWHGFKRINPPDDKRHLTRKCISIYLYTKDRPKEEIAPLHATFYVQRPPSSVIKEGHLLTQQDVDELKQLMLSRDTWIKFYQDQELKFSNEISIQRNYIDELLAAVRLPLTGYILQKKGSVKGAYSDGWVTSRMAVEIDALEEVKDLLVRGWIPATHHQGQVLRATIDGEDAGEFTSIKGGGFDWQLRLQRPLVGEFALAIETHNLRRTDTNNSDMRDLSFVLNEIRASH